MNIRNILKKIIFFTFNIHNFVLLFLKNANLGKNVRINGKLFIQGNGSLSVGDNTIINSSLIANPVGGYHQTILYIINGSRLRIGNHTGISNSIICCTNGITIGDNVKIGGGCGLYDSDFHSIDYLERRLFFEPNIKSNPIIIEDDVFIGTSTIILKGVTIGERSIIGAGSVVTKSVPKDEFWAGNPARFIRKLN